MAVAGIVILAVALASLGQVRNLYMYYAASMVLALGMSLAAWSSFNAALVIWFRQRRGTAIAVMSVGLGLGYSGALIMGTAFEWIGWRNTLTVGSVVILVLGVPLALVIRGHPEDRGYLADGKRLDAAALSASAQDAAATGLEVREALRMPAFYLLVLVLAQGAGGAATTAWITFQIPHLQSAGFSLQATGTVVLAYGIFQIGCRFIAGYVGDRFGRRQMYAAGWG